MAGWERPAERQGLSCQRTVRTGQRREGSHCGEQSGDPDRPRKQSVWTWVTWTSSAPREEPDGAEPPGEACVGLAAQPLTLELSDFKAQFCKQLLVCPSRSPSGAVLAPGCGPGREKPSGFPSAPPTHPPWSLQPPRQFPSLAVGWRKAVLHKFGEEEACLPCE